VQKFPEQERLLKILEAGQDFIKSRVLTTVRAQGLEFPVYGFTLGSSDPRLPTLGLFGGVHGLERIGSQTLLAYFESLFEQLKWDEDLRGRLSGVRIVSVPLVNPAGLYFGWRSNPNGVDLMRNSPVVAKVKPAFVLGGHRYSPKLPWYRGEEGAAMELEARALVDFVQAEMFESEMSMALDVHSGFGFKDRLWYPFAGSHEPFPRLKEVQKLESLLNLSFPNHIYSVEPQALSYTTHGDLWDFLWELHQKQSGSESRIFLPWTLEMGSWLWVRKNPLQLFSSMGFFNPMKVHRYRRTLRRHLPLIDFMLRATKNYRTWAL
jgi:hypothetical protein